MLDRGLTCRNVTPVHWKAGCRQLSRLGIYIKNSKGGKGYRRQCSSAYNSGDATTGGGGGGGSGNDGCL